MHKQTDHKEVKFKRHTHIYIHTGVEGRGASATKNDLWYLWCIHLEEVIADWWAGGAITVRMQRLGGRVLQD